MGMTATEKILAKKAGRDRVSPGEIVDVQVDLLMMNEGTASLAIPVFEQIGQENVWDPNRIALVNSHFVPAKDAAVAHMVKVMKDWSRKHNIHYYYEVGRGGIEHALLPEQGLVSPGMIIIGADSHSTTYGALGCFGTGVGSTDAAAVAATGRTWLKVPESLKLVLNGKRRPWVSAKDLILHVIGQIGVEGARYMAMEWSGDAIAGLSMDARMTITNMAIEAGGKSAFIGYDDVTRQYLEGRAVFPIEPVYSDPDAKYARVYEWDIADLEPQVAAPHRPDNVRPVSEFRGQKLDQVYIGSCTNGRIEDLRIAAGILKGRQVHPDVRLIVVPATTQVQLQAMREGLLEIFMEAGAVVSPPTCGACVGGHMGVLGKGDRCLSTTNRNFIGRMGHPESMTYLSSPAVAAASAVVGEIVHPADVMNEEVAPV